MNSAIVENLWKMEKILNQNKKNINLMTFRNLGRLLGLKDMQEDVLDKI